MSHQHKTIINQFHHWLALTYPTNRPDQDSMQYKQLRFAYFGGAASLMLEQLRIAEISEDAAVNTLRRHEAELIAFFEFEKQAHK